VEKRGAERFVREQMEVALARMPGALTRHPEEPGAERRRLRPAPGPAERGRPEHMEQLVGEDAQPGEHSVAVAVIDGALAEAKLIALRDPLLYGKRSAGTW
jgi:hypothetical protein